MSCDKVVAIGQGMAENLRQSGLDQAKLAVISNWPDPEILAPQPLGIKINHIPNDASPDRKDTSVHMPLHVDAAPKFRILYAGTLGRAHPVGTILDAAAILQKENSQIEFVFVGDGPVHERLALERAKRGLDNLRLLPLQPVERLRDLMQSGDVHLISMKTDTADLLVPSKFQAAMAAHRPCILVGPEQSDIGQLILKFSAGSIVSQGHGTVLAETIKSYLTDDVWFNAQKGAIAAAAEFHPDLGQNAWLTLALNIVQKSTH